MEKIKVVFVHDSLICGGAEQALFDLMHLLDKEKFEVTVLVQKQGGAWDQKFIDSGLNVIYDYSCRKATLNPITKLGNVVKKLRTDAAYRRDGEGLLDVCYPEGADIIVSYSMWDYPLCGFGAKCQVRKVHPWQHADQSPVPGGHPPRCAAAAALSQDRLRVPRRLGGIYRSHRKDRRGGDAL